MRNIPTVTRNLLVVNVLAFLAMYVLKHLVTAGGTVLDLNDLFGLHFFMAPDFHIYQLVTYMFMHANIEHIFFNMFALWMFGCVVENVWGPKKFLFYYIFCGIGAGLFQEVAQLVSFYTICDGQPMALVAKAYAQQLNLWTTVGASGAIYAILLAFGMIFPEERIFIFPLPVPIKAKWFVIIYAAIELFSALATSGDNVAHLAHLGGMVVGFFLIRYWQKHPSSRYGKTAAEQYFEQMRQRATRRQSSSRSSEAGNSARRVSSDGTSDHAKDWEYNARRQSEQEEIDAILDKIRKSGYDSLTKAEKQKLFDSSQK